MSKDSTEQPEKIYLDNLHKAEEQGISAQFMALTNLCTFYYDKGDYKQAVIKLQEFIGQGHYKTDLSGLSSEEKCKLFYNYATVLVEYCIDNDKNSLLPITYFKKALNEKFEDNKIKGKICYGLGLAYYDVYNKHNEDSIRYLKEALQRFESIKNEDDSVMKYITKINVLMNTTSPTTKVALGQTERAYGSLEKVSIT